MRLCSPWIYQGYCLRNILQHIFKIVLHQGLNKLHVVFGLVIPQTRKPQTTAKNLFHAAFSVPVSLFGYYIHFMILFIYGLTKTPSLTFAIHRLELRDGCTNCFIWPHFKCNEGRNIFRSPTVTPIWQCSSSHWIWSAVARHTLLVIGCRYIPASLETSQPHPSYIQWIYQDFDSAVFLFLLAPIEPDE